MAEESSPGDMRPLRDYYNYQMSPSVLSSPIPDHSPDLSNVVSESNLQLTRSVSCSNTALSSTTSVLAASMVDGVVCGASSESSATLTFQDLKVSVELGGIMRPVLEGVSGYAEPGKLLGIMGPPRSGTSTLLDTLAGKLTRNAVYEGEILLNGRRQQLTYGASAHVSKEDVLIGTLTVQETVYLSALLRLPESVPREEKMLIAERTIQDMGLWECAAVRVGNSFYQSGLTVGERRRLSVALELLTRPHLLYLDDPLNGLDSASALCLVARLKCLAMDWGRTVIGTFHHASADTFELMDNLCLLVKGRMVYFGDSATAVEHFSRSGYSCLPGYNAPEHILRTLDPAYDQVIAAVSSTASAFLLEDPGKREVQQLLRDHTAKVIKSLASNYAHSTFAAIAASRRKDLAKKKGAVLVSNGRHADFKRQVLVLSYRSILNCTRDLSYFCCRLGVLVVLMAAIGTIFFNVQRVAKDDSPNVAIQARFTCLFVILESMVLVAVTVETPFYLRELKELDWNACRQCSSLLVYLRERQNPHYGAGAFVMGSAAASVPLAWITSVLASAVVYFLPSLHTSFEQFAYFAGALLPATLLATEGVVQLAISALMLLSPPLPPPSPYVALALSLFIQGVCMLVAGFFRTLNSLPNPVWRYPLSFVSFQAYALRGLVANEFRPSKFRNTSLQVQDDAIRRFYGKAIPSKWRDLLIVIAIAIVCRILLYCCILTQHYIQPYARLWRIQHENKTWSNRNLAKRNRQQGKSDGPQPARSIVSSMASEEFETRLHKSKAVLDLEILQVP